MKHKLLTTLICICCLAGCSMKSSDGQKTSNKTTQIGSPTDSPKRKVHSLDLGFIKQTLLPSSTITFRLKDSSRIIADRAFVSFDGVVAERRIDKSFEAQLERTGDVGDLVVKLSAKTSLFAHTEKTKGIFAGSVSVKLKERQQKVARGGISNIHVSLVQKLVPSFQQFSLGDVYPNQKVRIKGTGVLRPTEGTTWAVVKSGQITLDGGKTHDLSSKKIPIKWADSRNRGYFYIDPGVLGVQKGTFEMTISFMNELKSGDTFKGQQTFPVSGDIQSPRIKKITPNNASRGQLIDVNGKGFVPNTEQNQSGIFLEFNGEFEPDNSGSSKVASVPFEDGNVREFAPSKVASHQKIRQEIWYDVSESRKLTGLGATPGVFAGKITPVLVDKWGQQRGEPWEGTFEIEPTKQVVFMKFLPAFTRGLEKYGLRNVESEIRQRVKRKTNEDYSDFNVEFRTKKPTNFASYAVIEVGGPDPSGNRKFGYDNSFNNVAKDTGNLHLNDYLGGVSAAASEAFNVPYGGIFINSFSIFSRQLNPNRPVASKAFDKIMKPVMPKLGGSPVRLDEYPNGPRAQKIDKAIEMVSSVVANTVTHEIGHSLGLTFVASDRQKPGPPFHNDSCPPPKKPCRYIMDGGSERPFKERAGLTSEPTVFNQRNRKYLNRHLPKN